MVIVYMVKEDGKKEVLEINSPGERNKNNKVYHPIAVPTCTAIVC